MERIKRFLTWLLWPWIQGPPASGQSHTFGSLPPPAGYQYIYVGTDVVSSTNPLPTSSSTSPSPISGTLVGTSGTVGESSHVLKASAGKLIQLVGWNGKSSSQYIQVFNTISVPAEGTAPTLPPILVPATSNFSLDCPVTGFDFTTGITVCNSSTPFRKTIGSADCFFTAEVI